ncbi:protein LURP-one-related 14-like [Hibiscus syriacus]|uniref:protein LURP-one-related 14-like n=1 Tax=Hibiscus syriacus TaxID=106335 RepID=UPI0019225F29|nr:protein LURP-one-related 14-like [Hibiscus syriacus]
MKFFTTLVILFLFLSFGNRVVMGQSSECEQPFPLPGCNQDDCNNLCIKKIGKTGKFRTPVYGVCFKTNTMDLIVKRKRHGFSNISYGVSDGNGNLFLHVDGSYMTLYRKRVIRNSAGFPILTIREKAITGKKWIVHRGESSERSQLLLTVQRSRIQPMKTSLEVFLAGNTDKDISNFLVVASNYPSQYIRVYKGDTITAEVNWLIFFLPCFTN